MDYSSIEDLLVEGFRLGRLSILFFTCECAYNLRISVSSLCNLLFCWCNYIVGCLFFCLVCNPLPAYQFHEIICGIVIYLLYHPL